MDLNPSFLHFEPQVEQLLGEAQLPQEELAVLLNFHRRRRQRQT